MNLKLEISKARQQMMDAAEKHAMNLLHPEVIRCSQQLDLLIVQAMTGQRRSRIAG